MTYRAEIELVPYAEEWPFIFEAERVTLASVFSASEFQIEHIGSTAVPGLGAKPIIDILIGARSLAEIETRIPATQTLGYLYVPEYEAVLPQRRYFAKPAVRPRQFHVHAVAIDSPFFAEHLMFRDALRADPRLVAEYFSLKDALAKEFGDDREGYASAKGPFVQSVVRRGAFRSDRAAVGA